MQKRSSLLMAWLWLAFSAAWAQNADVMLQGFNAISYQNPAGWYNVVSSKAAELKAAGFKAVWMPPPSDNTGGMGYLPRQYYNLNTAHGSAMQLQSCINALHGQGIKVLADIVINHRVGTSNWADFTNPSWGCWAICNDDEWRSVGGNPCGNNDTGIPYEAGRDLDHTNPTVQADIRAWMQWLKNTVGFDGWRYDYCKGFSPYYVGLYNDATAPYISIGEYWDGNRQLVQNWVDGTAQKSTAFDFPLKYQLHTAVNGNYAVLNAGGAMNGLAGWSPTKSVTFLDNHDTYRDNNIFPGDNGKVLQGYAYILTHPGIPMVFWDHYFDWGTANRDAIAALIKLRYANQITATSSLNIQVAQGNLYAAVIDGKLAVKLGPADWQPSGTGWFLKTWGTNYAVWDRINPCAAATPTLTITPGGPNTFAGTLQVTAQATAPNGTTPTLYFTTNGTTPTTASASAQGTRSFSFNSTTTLRVMAQGTGGCQSATQSHTYTLAAPVAGFSVFFQRPAGWTAAKVYWWNPSPVGSLPAVAWPGVDMQPYGNGWFKYTFRGVAATNLIFTDGTRQTADLTRNRTGSFSSNAWSDTRPPMTYVMDGSLDAAATKVAEANGVALYADYNGTTLYMAAVSARNTTQDVFLLAAANLGTAIAAPWAKAGTIPGGCIYIGNESTNNWAGWTGGQATTVASNGFVEGTVNVSRTFGTAPSLHLSAARYATADGGALQAQAPAATQPNGNLDATEFWLMNLAAF